MHVFVVSTNIYRFGGTRLSRNHSHSNSCQPLDSIYIGLVEPYVLDTRMRSTNSKQIKRKPTTRTHWYTVYLFGEHIQVTFWHEFLLSSTSSKWALVFGMRMNGVCRYAGFRASSTHMPSANTMTNYTKIFPIWLTPEARMCVRRTLYYENIE